MGNKVTNTALLALILCFPVLPLAADTHHMLREGDTLYSLSRRYGVSVEDLLRANNISDPSALSVGMNLLIPGIDTGRSGNGPETGTGEYTVEKGDTYYSIARKHGMDVDSLLAINGRGADRVLRPGEILLVSSSGGGGVDGPDNPGPTPTPTPGPEPGKPVMVTKVPWWPVAGWKSPLDGKLVGVSISADPRSYVHAVAEGSVVWTGPYRGFGHVVLVDSNGYIYLYGGNEDLFVNVGQNVTAGSRIGRLGAPGPEGETQEMIFSVFREGVPVSPDDAPRG